jgi:hypothetical protein
MEIDLYTVGILVKKKGGHFSVVISRMGTLMPYGIKLPEF